MNESKIQIFNYKNLIFKSIQIKHLIIIQIPNVYNIFFSFEEMKDLYKLIQLKLIGKKHVYKLKFYCSPQELNFQLWKGWTAI